MIDFLQIKEKLLGPDYYPFKMDDFWKEFGYSNRQNFKRSLKGKYLVYVIKRVKLNERETDEIYLSKFKFVELANGKFADDINWRSIFISFWVKHISDGMGTFANTGNKKAYYPFLQGWQKEKKGWMYKYSLDTLNLAKDTQLDSFELYDICYHKFRPKYADYISPDMDTYKSTFGNNQNVGVPYFNFNSLYPSVREIFIVFISFLINHYKEDRIKTLYLEAYKKAIRRLLDKIEEVLYPKKETKKKNADDEKDDFSRRKKPNCLPDSLKDQMNDIFKKAAVLCHPDKHSNAATVKKATDLFQRLNNARQLNDIDRVKELFEKSKLLV